VLSEVGKDTALLPTPVSHVVVGFESAHQCFAEDVLLLLVGVSPANESGHTGLLKSFFQHIERSSARFSNGAAIILILCGRQLGLAHAFEIASLDK